MGTLEAPLHGFCGVGASVQGLDLFLVRVSYIDSTTPATMWRPGQRDGCCAVVLASAKSPSICRERLVRE